MNIYVYTATPTDLAWDVSRLLAQKKFRFPNIYIYIYIYIYIHNMFDWDAHPPKTNSPGNTPVHWETPQFTRKKNRSLGALGGPGGPGRGAHSYPRMRGVCYSPSLALPQEPTETGRGAQRGDRGGTRKGVKSGRAPCAPWAPRAPLVPRVPWAPCQLG